jgi:hypothetical protein
LTNWTDLGKLLLGAAGLYFVNSLGRKNRQEIQAKVADQRFEAYAALWVETKLAAGIRVLTGEGPLTQAERKQLAERLTTWYYAKGNGMLLSEDTRKIFIEAKHNLIREPNALRPLSLSQTVRDSSDPDSVWGAASLRQISLLRNSMRADLAIYSSPASPAGGKAGLKPQDKEFLKACEVQLWRRPWRSTLRGVLSRLLSRGNAGSAGEAGTGPPDA